MRGCNYISDFRTSGLLSFELGDSIRFVEFQSVDDSSSSPLASPIKHLDLFVYLPLVVLYLLLLGHLFALIDYEPFFELMNSEKLHKAFVNCPLAVH